MSLIRHLFTFRQPALFGSHACPLVLLLGVLSLGLPPADAAIPATGAADRRLASFDRLMVDFLRKRRIPGAALAIAKDGRLVYARGFGYADVENKDPVEPDALFRIASLSKPITAVAVLQLIEQNRLRFTDKGASLLEIKPYLSDTAFFDERIQEITIQQLLQHRGGWDRERSLDPMFLSVKIARTLLKTSPAEPDDILRYTFGRRLDFDPGSRYAYANVGYCVLGRIIERVTGESYEQHVRANVLAPLGITRMRMGRTLPSERADGEVCYYTPGGETGSSVFPGEVGLPVPRPYGCWALEGMDASGGWIGSAIDLVRFAAAFDDPHHSPLLKSSTISLMTMRPAGRAGFEGEGKPKETYYGCGWHVRPTGRGAGDFDLCHAGSLDGTTALLVHRHDRLSWAVLINSRASAKQKAFETALEPLLHEAADAIREWPEFDLFRDSDASATRQVVSEERVHRQTRMKPDTARQQ